MAPSVVIVASCSARRARPRSEEHTSELQSRSDLVCRLLLEKKKKKTTNKARQMNTHTAIHQVEDQVVVTIDRCGLHGGRSTATRTGRRAENRTKYAAALRR